MRQVKTGSIKQNLVVYVQILILFITLLTTQHNGVTCIKIFSDILSHFH